MSHLILIAPIQIEEVLGFNYNYPVRRIPKLCRKESGEVPPALYVRIALGGPFFHSHTIDHQQWSPATSTDVGYCSVRRYHTIRLGSRKIHEFRVSLWLVRVGGQTSGRASLHMSALRGWSNYAELNLCNMGPSQVYASQNGPFETGLLSNNVVIAGNQVRKMKPPDRVRSDDGDRSLTGCAVHNAIGEGFASLVVHGSVHISSIPPNRTSGDK